MIRVVSSNDHLQGLVRDDLALCPNVKILRGLHMTFPRIRLTSRAEPSRTSLLLRGGMLLVLVATLGIISVYPLGNAVLMLLVTMGILVAIAGIGRFLLRERDESPVPDDIISAISHGRVSP